jgi:hypothetical protein
VRLLLVCPLNVGMFCLLVYTAFFIVLGGVVGFASGFLVFCVGALECYPGVCLKRLVIFLTLALW